MRAFAERPPSGPLILWQIEDRPQGGQDNPNEAWLVCSVVVMVPRCALGRTPIRSEVRFFATD
jgi:hypothetical protein